MKQNMDSPDIKGGTFTPSKENIWKIIESYFDKKYLSQLVRHQIESYNDFIENQIKKTIEMFNPVVVRSPQDYFKDLDKYRLEIHIQFTNLSLYRPEIHENNGATKLMFPAKARYRNFTYTSNLTLDLDITYIVRTGENLEKEEKKNIKLSKIQFGKIPIMLNSSICILKQYGFINNSEDRECKMDPGGYFIINGSEKTCLGQEKAADNKIFCFKQKPGHKYLYTAEMRSVPDWKCISPKQVYMMISSKMTPGGYEILVQLPRMKKPTPLFILFRALGIKTDKQICKYILLNIDDTKNNQLLKALVASISSTSNYVSYEDSVDYIVSNVMYTPINMEKEEGNRKKREFAFDILKNDLFPNCKRDTEKKFLLGYMTNMLLNCYLGYKPPDDRDSYLNKRIETTGTLLNNLFRNYFNKVVKDMQKQIVREINNGSWKSQEDYRSIVNLTNIYKIVKSSTIENGLKRALATGDFGIKHLNSNKVGVAQVLSRLTYISTLSHLRRVSTPFDKSGKLTEPRKLPPSSWGFFCPAETPEGQSVGVIKNISYLSTISGNVDSSSIYEYIEPFIDKLDEDKNVEFYHNKVKIFVNGCWLGITTDPILLYNNMKEKKYKGIINIYTSIIFNTHLKEIHIRNDCGRMLRPVFRVLNNKLILNQEVMNRINKNELGWNDLLISNKIPTSIIEYIDPDEQEYSKIAMKHNKLSTDYNFTHCEIHASTIFGVLACCIPFPQNNQSPRNTYQCAMGKQAIGIYVSNFHSRLDKTAYILNNVMRPLVDTRMMNIMKLNNLPSGNQIIVAIMVNGGYNQEDSILFNKASIDRGMFHATVYCTEKDEDKKINGDEEIRTKPNKSITKNIKFANYDKLDKHGVIPENELVEDKDIIIAKVITVKENKNDNSKLIKYEDQSRSYRTNEECYIDKNFISRNGDGYNVQKVRVRSLRLPSIGDKFSSRHGQKGTIGNIINEEDMPFTKNGLRPDIIINPHAIPSRMTIAQLKETLLGKALLELGLFGDGTCFEEFSMKPVFEQLAKQNYESKGNEIMYDGRSGEQIATEIFIGPTWYQRLKHMVIDKEHSRSQGPMVNLTRQPAEGRSRDGGLRIGEMERDCMASHGMSRFSKDRLYDVSDKYHIYVCKLCGIQAQFNDEEKIHNCPICKNKTTFSRVNIPFSCKLLFQELISMNIVPRILT
jgi:DNA-directed RNA polymerase II subunit RPB2